VTSPSDDALTHLDTQGRARMVEVGDKPVTARSATASCEVHLAPETARLLLDGALPKGDALPVVRLAGIQAAKRTHELIPLCHQLALTSVEVDVEVAPDDGVAVITATARAVDRTGVEMEAMTAASVVPSSGPLATVLCPSGRSVISHDSPIGCSVLRGRSRWN